MTRPPPSSTLFPYTTLFRSRGDIKVNAVHEMLQKMSKEMDSLRGILNAHEKKMERMGMMVESHADILDHHAHALDRKSTRLNSSHANISYAVFCLKKKKSQP